MPSLYTRRPSSGFFSASPFLSILAAANPFTNPSSLARPSETPSADGLLPYATTRSSCTLSIIRASSRAANIRTISDSLPIRLGTSSSTTSATFNPYARSSSASTRLAVSSLRSYRRRIERFGQRVSLVATSRRLVYGQRSLVFTSRISGRGLGRRRCRRDRPGYPSDDGLAQP